MDTYVTDNIDTVIRMVETGPKIAQRYIARPLTYQNRKIDLRFIVILNQVNPLQLTITNDFWIRFANNEFMLDRNSFYDYETHFTVMNYGGSKMLNMIWQDFIPMFDEEYQGRTTWKEMQDKIYQVIKETFIAAAIHKPEMQDSRVKIFL